MPAEPADHTAWTQPGPTLQACLLAARNRHPDRLAFVLAREGSEEAISYEALITGAEVHARLLRERGVGPGDGVLILGPHDAMLLHAFIGCLIVGAIPAFLPPLSERQEATFFWRSLARMTADLSVAAWIVSPDIDFDPAVLGLDTLPPVIRPGPQGAPSRERAAWHSPAPDDTAFLQFSSGTTGTRKGVLLSHAQVLAQMSALHGVLGTHPEDRIASWLPLYHDMGLIACFVFPLLTGVPVVWMSPFEWVRTPGMLFDAIDRHRATLVWLPNFAFHHLCAGVPAGSHQDLRSVRAFIDCSEACKPATFDQFVARFADQGITHAQLHTCYAMAETVFAVTHSRLGQPARRERFRFVREGATTHAMPGDGDGAREHLSVGRLLPGFDCRIGGGVHGDAQDGVVGEIHVSGPCLSAGYHRNPLATAAAFQDGWYATGDLGFLWQGELFVTGRLKEIIIVNGRNYFAHDVEAIANTVPGIKPGRNVAIGVDNALTGSEDLVLLCESPAPDESLLRPLAARLRAALSAELGLAARIRWVPPRWLIKTTSGKIDRASNKRKYLDEHTLSDDTLSRPHAVRA